MTKYLLSLLFCLGAFVALQAQFSDDFESYTAGDFVSPQSDDWTTWSGIDGGADDVVVVDDKALSGSNSLYFSSTAATGGPQDLVLPFGGKKTTGQFTLDMNFFVEEGGGAYFNLQGEETIGTTWTSNVWFNEDGTLQVSDGANTLAIQVPYTQGVWHKITFDINLTGNSWKFSLNDECLGSFVNPDNSIASMDLFPLTGHSFWVDDVSYTYDPNAAGIVFDADLSVNPVGAGGLTGQERLVSGTVTNVGEDVITSVEVNYTASGGIDETKSLTGLNLATGQTVEWEMDSPFVIVEGEQFVTLELTSINGQAADDNPCNNRRQLFLNGVTPAPQKRVLGEEGTGTWCGWCPRGHVFMEYMEDQYDDYWVGIAVHNGDVMTVDEYDDGLGFTGFPGATVMRNGVVDPSAMEAPFLTSIQEAPRGYFTHDMTWDGATRTLDVTVTLHALQSISTAYDVSLAVIEDNLVGPNSSYNQANYYSNSQSLIDIHGNDWFDLPASVPFTDIVYQDVARAILPDFGGMAVPSSIAAGESVDMNFSYVVPEDYHVPKMRIATLLHTPFGEIDNVFDSPLSLFVNTEAPSFANDVSIYPNPITDISYVKLNIDQQADVQIQVRNVMGELVAQRNYGKQQGEMVYPIDGSAFASGVYLIQIYVGNEMLTKKVTVAH